MQVIRVKDTGNYISRTGKARQVENLNRAKTFTSRNYAQKSIDAITPRYFEHGELEIVEVELSIVEHDSSEDDGWHVYMLRCSDNSLYTGITTDIERRLEQHNSGNGSVYVRSRRPAELVYSEAAENRSQASKREYEIKQLSKDEKEELVHKNT